MLKEKNHSNEDSSTKRIMGKEEHIIASLEGYAEGHVDRDTLNAVIAESSDYASTQEAIFLHHAAQSAIEYSGLRQDLQIIFQEAS